MGIFGGLEDTWNNATPDMGNQPVESTLDWGAGSTDETVGQVASDGMGWFPNQPVEAGLDWAAGSTDEWVGRGTQNQQVIEGAFDWAGGSFDESLGGTGNQPVEGALDWVAGSTDEAAGSVGSSVAGFGSNMMLLMGLGIAALFALVVVV